MIKKNYAVIIYGINSVGKSVQSQLLIKEIAVCELQSTDNLIKIYKHLNPESLYVKETSSSSWKIFGKKNDENIIKGFNGNRNLIMDYIGTLIDRIPNEKLSIIFEGVHFNPEIISNHSNVKVIPILLTLQDENIHRERIIEKAQGRKELEERLLDSIRTSRIIQDFLIKEAQDHNCFIIDTGKDGPKETLSKIKNLFHD